MRSEYRDMPTYVYEVIHDDGSGGERFEVVQPMSDPPLTTHPETNLPVRRVLLPPNIGGKWSDAGTKQNLSDKNLDRLGFTKYQKAGDGKYEKRAGSGPPTLSAD
jgi:predicted nucleic acid-binding Zn ribbon protein